MSWTWIDMMRKTHQLEDKNKQISKDFKYLKKKLQRICNKQIVLQFQHWFEFIKYRTGDWAEEKEENWKISNLRYLNCVIME